MITQAEIEFFLALFAGIEPIIKAEFAAHKAGLTNLADAKSSIAGALANLGTGIPANDAAAKAAEDAKFGSGEIPKP